MSKDVAVAATNISLTSFFGESDIVVNVGAISRGQALRRLLEHLAERHGIVDVDVCYNAVLEREEQSHTVIANGLAVPHARLEHLKEACVGIATSREGIQFCEGQVPVHLILLILIPRDQPGLYLQILRALATVLRDRQAAKNVSRLDSPAAVMQFFEHSDLILPAYVCAGDIMRKPRARLHCSENLQKAIDCFISQNVVEIPVVNDAEELVGTVSASTVLQVCLPEYLLWTRDLSSIVNFEPFLNVLRSEQQMPLSQILRKDQVTVQLKAPAIAVAAELARQNVTQCYVLNGKKLVGEINLPTFLDRVFRE